MASFSHNWRLTFSTIPCGRKLSSGGPRSCRTPSRRDFFMEIPWREIAMPFVNELIYRKDREFFRLDAFDKRFPLHNPNDCWTIDRGTGVFLRALRPHVGKAKARDPESRHHKDFHFHWNGYDFLIAVRSIGAQELREWDGEIFDDARDVEPGAEVLLFYLRHLEEVGKPNPLAPSAVSCHRHALLRDLRSALAATSQGGPAYLTVDDDAKVRSAIIKIAPAVAATD